MIINCPICGGQLTITPQHFGQNVNCPHCARVFQVPAATPQPVPQPLQYQAQPTPMAGPVPPHLQQGAQAYPQSTAYPPGQAAPAQGVPDEEASQALASFREKRDKASSKMIIWVIAVGVGVPVVIGVLVLLFMAQKSSKESKQEKLEAQKTRSRAIEAAKTNLSVRGYAVQSDKIKISGGDSAPLVSGWATKGDATHEFKCKFRVTETSDKVAFSVEYIEIDGDVVYSK